MMEGEYGMIGTVAESGALSLNAYCEETARAAKAASRNLAVAIGAVRNQALLALADGLSGNLETLLAANAMDVDAAVDSGLKPASVDRLRLDRKRIEAMAQTMAEIAAFAD